MNDNLNNVVFLFPKELNLEKFGHGLHEEPFSGKAIAYLNALSLALSEDPRTKNYPDVATFAFFCRRANVIQLKKKYYPEENLRSGRGIVFHITPSNVPTTFAYSLVSGILSGNVNIVRVSTKKFEQVDIVCDAISKLSQDKQHQDYSSLIAIVRYDQQSNATAYFSSICDVRIIWGSDSTIEEIRKINLPFHAFDLTFGDRCSLCVINADLYINETSPKKIASAFYNDTYLFDQNACTSPHLVIWLGTDENVKRAKGIFWSNLHEVVTARYQFQPHLAVDKLTAFYNQAIHMEGIKKTETPDNLIWRIELNNLPEDIDQYRCNGGYFSEYTASLSELNSIISDKYQTLVYYGFEKEDLIKFISQNKPGGIDRIVPIGQTTDFSLTRDGCNLIETLSREISVL